jgi:Ni/Fe-hydrogenase subunit HybB-like protein
VGLGLALPLALLLTGSGSAGRIFFAAVISLLGVFAMRVDFVAVGQIIPQIVVEGVQHTVFHHYAPSWTEWALIAGAAGASALIFSFCEKRFNLDAEDVDKASADRYAAKTENPVSV